MPCTVQIVSSSVGFVVILFHHFPCCPPSLLPPPKNGPVNAFSLSILHNQYPKPPPFGIYAERTIMIPHTSPNHSIATRTMGLFLKMVK